MNGHSTHYAEGKAVARSRGGSKDINHDAIALVFDQLGCSVCHTHEVGFGFPDLVIGLVGITALVEIKNPNTAYGKRGLTPSQQLFCDKWRGRVPDIVTTEQEAIELVQHMRHRARGKAA